MAEFATKTTFWMIVR